MDIQYIFSVHDVFRIRAPDDMGDVALASILPEPRTGLLRPPRINVVPVDAFCSYFDWQWIASRTKADKANVLFLRPGAAACLSSL